MTEPRSTDPARVQRLTVAAATLVLLAAGAGLAYASGAGPRVADPALIVRTVRPVETTPSATGSRPGHTSSPEQPAGVLGTNPKAEDDEKSRQPGGGGADDSGGTSKQTGTRASESEDEERETVRPEIRDEEDSDEAPSGDAQDADGGSSDDDGASTEEPESDNDVPRNDQDGERTEQEPVPAQD